MPLRTIICPSCEHYGLDANCEACRGNGAINVRSEYWAKPIPPREFDWSAIDDGTYDGAPDSKSNAIGYGETEQDAIDDLLGQIGV